MPGNRVILFDLGGVLIENSGEHGLSALLPYRLSRDEIWGRWLESEAVKEFERGRLSPEVFAARFIAEWRLELPPAEFLASFAGWPKGLFKGAAELVRGLRARHRVACLSNVNELHWARFPELPELFDATFASHLTGHLKPEAGAYQHVLRELGVPPDAVWFFDDLAQNVEAARSAGMHALRVRSFAEIEPALRAEGLWDGAR